MHLPDNIQFQRFPCTRLKRTAQALLTRVQWEFKDVLPPHICFVIMRPPHIDWVPVIIFDSVDPMLSRRIEDLGVFVLGIRNYPDR